MQAGLVLCSFTLMQLENLHHFSNFCFKMIWHKLSMAALAESGVTACHQPHVWTDHSGDITTWFI
jgi:hypothetical protein